MSNNNLTCALSGQSPIPDPVVTPTGQICSKKLLLQKLVDTNYTNPFLSSSQPLDESQLIELQTTTANQTIQPPKPTTSNSIPSILNTLSSEYDAIVLELYDTRKALEETRKELSVALYQNDAAIRVIARVVLERDLARRQLAEAAASAESVVGAGVGGKRKREDGGENVNVVEEDTDVKMADSANDGDKSGGDGGGVPNHIPEEHSSQLQTKWSQLFKSRKEKTKAGPNHASLDTISTFQPMAKKYHKTTNKGITSLASPIFLAGNGEEKEEVIVSSGSSDKQLIWYNSTKHQIQHSVTLKKPLLNPYCLSTFENVTAAVTNDYILHVYMSNGDAAATLVLDNQDSIVGVCVHPTCQHVFVSTESGKIYIIHLKKSEDGGETSLENVAILNGFDENENGVKCTCIGLHPDGLIFALGRNDGKISIWDLKTEKLASILEGSSESNPSALIQTMTFSEKGYHLAASTEDGSIAVWDLRKQKKIASVACDDDDKEAYATVLSFDPIGKHFAFGTSHGKTVVTTVKEWNKKISLVDEKKEKSGSGKITGLVWGADAQGIVTSGEKDRVVKFWGVTES